MRVKRSVMSYNRHKNLLTMEIVRRNLSRWIPTPVSSGGHGITKVFLLLISLEFLPYGAGQPGSPANTNNNGSAINVPIAVLMMVVFFIFFIMAWSSILCRRFADRSQQGTTEATAGVRLRRAARGLDAEVIESFPAFLYSEVKGLKVGKGGVECAVCLNEFEDDETLRLMPPCSHVFHAGCIDVWLSSHSTCPVCRANLVVKPGESFPSQPVMDLNTNSGTDPETGDTGRRVLESPDVRLIDSVTWNNENRPRRSRSTGLPTWRITGIFFPRSHSTGHSLVLPGEKLDRFTLQLPEEVRRQLMKSSTLNRVRSHMALPQARSSRRGYRSGSVGSERPYGQHNNRRAISLSLSFSFRTCSVRSSASGGNPAVAAPPKGLLGSIKSPFDSLSKGKDEEAGERSFDRLRPDGRV